MPDRPYLIIPSARARRDIERLPRSAAFACLEFISGPLAENPRRMGKALQAPFLGLHAARGGNDRVIFRIDEADHAVMIVHIDNRADVYRTTSGSPQEVAIRDSVVQVRRAVIR